MRITRNNIIGALIITVLFSLLTLTTFAGGGSAKTADELDAEAEALREEARQQYCDTMPVRMAECYRDGTKCASWDDAENWYYEKYGVDHWIDCREDNTTPDIAPGDDLFLDHEVGM